MKRSDKLKKQFLLTLWIGIMFVFATITLSAQSYVGLNQLEGHKTSTYYSDGSQVQAEAMAKRCDNVLLFYKSLIEFEPSVTLLVLSPADWNKYTNFPVYGMPHYKDAETLVVASEDNNFWKSFIPPLDQLPKELAQEISKTYADNDHSVSMRRFFDLLAIHELGHAFHEQGGLTMQRKWMGELFANFFLHTYIAEAEPDLIPALTVFPQMVVSSTNKSDLTFTTLNELESNYNLLGKEYPNNYGWYQARWHIAAGKIYDTGGTMVFKKLWQTLKAQKEPLDDTAFAALLSTQVHQSVANVQQKWNE